MACDYMSPGAQNEDTGAVELTASNAEIQMLVQSFGYAPAP